MIEKLHLFLPSIVPVLSTVQIMHLPDQFLISVPEPMPETPTFKRATQSVTAHENAAPASGANSLLPPLQQRTPPASPIFLRANRSRRTAESSTKGCFQCCESNCRTLSSQQDTSPTQSLPPVSLPPVSLPHQKMVMHSIGLAGDDPLPERYKQIHVGNDDFNLFEDTLSTQAGASDAPRTTPKTALSRPEEKRVQDLLSQLPNLSYMFRWGNAFSTDIWWFNSRIFMKVHFVAAFGSTVCSPAWAGSTTLTILCSCWSFLQIALQPSRSEVLLIL